MGADPNKIVVVGCGVEQAFYDVNTLDLSQFSRPTENPYTLVIGGLRLKKGGDFVIKVAQELLKQNSDIQIVVAGDSEPVYISAVKDLPNIKCLGLVPDDDLPKLLKCASSLLFLSHYEGFGIPAIEAMAVGTPAVVANRASLPEVVGDAGIVVEPEASGEIADVLDNLNNDSALRETYIQRGYDHVEQYTWSRCADRVVEAFNKFS